MFVRRYARHPAPVNSANARLRAAARARNLGRASSYRGSNDAVPHGGLLQAGVVTLGAGGGGARSGTVRAALANDTPASASAAWMCRLIASMVRR